MPLVSLYKNIQTYVFHIYIYIPTYDGPTIRMVNNDAFINDINNACLHALKKMMFILSIFDLFFSTNI